MTFIASVIAKNGVAIIADSLVTTKTLSLDYSNWVNFLKNKGDETGSLDSIKIDPHEIIRLFSSNPHHTKDYEEKLFKFDEYTCITTAGWAEINNKRIGEIVFEISKNNGSYSDINDAIQALKNHLKEYVKAHIEENKQIGVTNLLITHFDNHGSGNTTIKKLVINESNDQTHEENYFRIEEFHPLEKVVCDGQNRISERILFGEAHIIDRVITILMNKITTDFNFDKEKLNEYRMSLFKEKEIEERIHAGLNIFKLSDLSLQQAVDLAALLMRLEMDFQTYTEDIPTVGGVIKLAVIDKEGFRFIAGDEITRPTNI